MLIRFDDPLRKKALFDNGKQVSRQLAAGKVPAQAHVTGTGRYRNRANQRRGRSRAYQVSGQRGACVWESECVVRVLI